jgi:Mor family transcriptional regulator
MNRLAAFHICKADIDFWRGFMSKENMSLHWDMIILCTDVVGSEIAKKGIRALYQYFGGQMIYIPIKNNTGKCAKKIFNILAGAVGDKFAQKMLEKLMVHFGGLEIYIPFERYAFRKTIALEIYERNHTNNESINDLAREYNISFAFAYTLWKEGQQKKLHS